MGRLKLYNQFVNESSLNSNVGLFIFSNKVVLYDPLSETVYGYISLIKDKTHNVYYFPEIAAKRGLGPTVFEFAMMYVYTNNSDGLMITRDGDIRSEAFNVWKKFYYRADVIKHSLNLKDDLYNFAIITGDDNNYEEPFEKEIEYEFHEGEGNGENIKIYNTMMKIKPSKEYEYITRKYSDTNLDLNSIIDKGRDFFSLRYNE